MTRPLHPDTIVSEGQVIGYGNEMAIRYLDRVNANDQDYEVRLKGGISITV